MRGFTLEGGILTITECTNHRWTMAHYDVLLKMAETTGGLEYRKGEEDTKITEKEVAICEELVQMQFASLVHSTYFFCWRLTPDGARMLVLADRVIEEEKRNPTTISWKKNKIAQVE